MESPLSNSPLTLSRSVRRPFGRRPSPPFFFGIAAASAAVEPKKGKVDGGGGRLYRKRKTWGLFLFICFSETVQSSAEWTNHISGLTANQGTLWEGLGLGELTLVCLQVLSMIFYLGCLPEPQLL